MPSWPPLRAARLACALSLVFALGCPSADAPPQHFLVIDADDESRAAGAYLRIRACDLEGEVFDEHFTLGEAVSFPVRVPFTPAEGDTTRRFGALLDLHDSDGVLRARLRHRGGYEGPAETELSFLAECLDRIECGAGEICAVGARGATCEALTGDGPDCLAVSDSPIDQCRMCVGDECIALTHATCGEDGVCFAGRCVEPTSYWPLDDLTGGEAADQRGTTPLDITGTPEIVLTPVRGRVARFEDEDALVAPVVVSRVEMREFTYAFWYRATQSPVSDGWLFAETGAALGDRALNGLILAEGRPLGQVRLANDKLDVVAAVAADFDAGEWHHYAMTGGATQWRIFVDGVFAGSVDVPAPASVNAFARIGVGLLNRGTGEGFIGGEFDDVMVFDSTADDETLCALAHPLCN